MSRAMRSGAILAALMLVAACGGSDDAASPAVTDSTTTPGTTVEAAAETTIETATTIETTTTVPVDEVDINHLQVIGSHNSYHLIPEPALFAGIAALSPELAAAIEYSHLPLAEQLGDHGIRQFELDVFADPDGGLFANRAANPVVGLDAASGLPELDQPGFKVMHTQDFDYGTTCSTLVACLEEIRDWSSANPNHVPIMVMIETKEQSVPDAAAAEGLELTVDLPWAQPVAITADLLDALDAEIRSVFGPDQIIEPDEVRGDAATLNEAVTTVGWPTLEASRGQVMFSLNNGGVTRDMYIVDTPNLEGRLLFTNAPLGAPDAAFVRFDDPNDPGLDEAALAGYLVRTRTDEPTVDARTNATVLRYAALVSGAHFLSTDYYLPSSFFESTYVVKLPGGAVARCNPVTAPPSCNDADLTE